ncbi:GTPase [Microcystis aeruginosa]|uniref:GTPase n=1 Tax=Microcystis aeruginosa TaxID=1126 RepID=UPI001882960E|nr:GTPase [Microcystis aeruginosa]MBE8996487.1 50S ribosome-binding GTPase [Microcystis aeruginosa LEGE 91341]
MTHIVILSLGEKAKVGELKTEIKTVLDKMSPPNIAVIGRTGAGKSTLINGVFGSDLAKTGVGLPVSDAFVRYPEFLLDEKPLVIVFDSAGYEMGKEILFRNSVIKFIQDKKLLEIEEQVHLVWYVIHAGLKRFEHFDADIIASLRSERVPVIIVLSQADLARPAEIAKLEKTIKEYKEAYKLDELRIIKIAADPINGESFGVSELVELSSALLPELYTEAFIARQIADLKLKKKLAAKYVRLAAAGCFSTGFVPIPNTTPAATIATQTLLCTKIAALYGQGDWIQILDKAGGVTVASMLTVAVTWVLDLFSTFLPPANPVTGAISGATAATYITVVGLTYTSVFEKLTIKDLTGAEKEDVEEFIRKTFREEFKKNLKFRILSEGDLQKIEESL